MDTAYWIDKLEDRIGQFHIKHIALGLAALSGVTFFLIKLNPSFYSFLTLHPQAVLNGEVWRLVTFLLIPGTGNPIFVVFYLLLTWWVGENLESVWGPFKLNLYFLLAIISLAFTAFFVTQAPVYNAYLYSSLLMAFGTAMPDEELMIFPFPIPIQAKFLAIFNALLLFVVFVVYASSRILIVASCMNYFLFFAPALYGFVRRNWLPQLERRKNPRKNRRL